MLPSAYLEQSSQRKLSSSGLGKHQVPVFRPNLGESSIFLTPYIRKTLQQYPELCSWQSQRLVSIESQQCFTVSLASLASHCGLTPSTRPSSLAQACMLGQESAFHKYFLRASLPGPSQRVHSWPGRLSCLPPWADENVTLTYGLSTSSESWGPRVSSIPKFSSWQGFHCLQSVNFGWQPMLQPRGMLSQWDFSCKHHHDKQAMFYQSSHLYKNAFFEK